MWHMNSTEGELVGGLLRSTLARLATVTRVVRHSSRFPEVIAFAFVFVDRCAQNLSSSIHICVAVLIRVLPNLLLLIIIILLLIIIIAVTALLANCFIITMLGTAALLLPFLVPHTLVTVGFV